MSEITWAGVNSNIPKHLPYADEVDMEVLWSLYKLVEAELNLISKARHAEISKGDIDNPNIKPMNLKFGRLRNWLDEISNHLDIDYWVEHDKHYEAYLRYRAGAWNEGHAAKGFMEWIAETIGMGKPATEPTAAALEAYPDLYRSGDYSVYYDPDYQEYIVASGGGDPLSARKTLDEAKAIADAYASEGDKAEPTAAAQGEGVPASVDDLSPAQKEVWVRLALNQADVQIAALEAALQQAQRERDAANELLAKIERRMPMVQPFDLGVHYYSETYNAWLVGDWIRAYQKAASAQQAAQPADGEG